jgi:hypothetical protein
MYNGRSAIEKRRILNETMSVNYELVYILNICLVHVKGESLYRHSLLINPIHLVVNKICLKQKNKMAAVTKNRNFFNCPLLL